jgi:hypothetical protein
MSGFFVDVTAGRQQPTKAGVFDFIGRGSGRVAREAMYFPAITQPTNTKKILQTPEKSS